MPISFFFSGSRSDHFEQAEDVANPLPPCPGSPNCVRISRKFKQAPDLIHKAAISALKKMGPDKLKPADDTMRIAAIFKVFIYKDDFVVQVTVDKDDEASSLLHIRSSSRKGHSDLGVNRRRVVRFLRLLKKQL